MNLNDDIDRIAAEHPGRTALVFPTPAGEKSMTYRELQDKVLRAAAAFLSRGIGSGDCVAIIHRNDPAFVVAYFGLIRVGAVAVPINFMIQNPEELRFMFGHCGAKGVVTQREFLPGIRAALKGLDLKHVWSTDSAAGEAEPFWPFVEAAGPLRGAKGACAQHTVTILYTSGTTGLPKGVMLTHANLAANCDATAQRLRFTPEDVWIAVLPMFHTFGWTVCVLAPLRMGGKIVIAPSVAPPEPWLAAMGRHGVSVFACVPQVHALISRPSGGYRDIIRREGFLSRVRVSVSGASPLNAQVHQDYKDAFGLDITEGYGLTEVSPVATMTEPGRPKIGAVGPAIPGVSIRIVDDAGRALPMGEEGEVLIKGPNVMKGYYNNEEATRQAVSPEGWLKSGDIGALDADGCLYIRDRKKDMIIVKGLKVFPAQLERVLLTHPGVQEAAVVGIPDQDSDERIKAFIVLKEGTRADLAELQRFCRENFDPYKRPRVIEFIKEIPKNALQKPLKRLLRQKESEGAISSGAPAPRR